MYLRHIKYYCNTLPVTILLLISLVACSNTPSTQTKVTPSATTVPATPLATATPAGPPAGTVLYQSDWTKGLSQWKATKGWQVHSGYLETDYSDNISLTVPYTTKLLNYAVEFRLQIVSIPKNGGYFMFWADQTATESGFHGDVLGLLAPGDHPASTHPLVEVLIEPDAAMGAPVVLHDYEGGSNYHTYRLEVYGPRVVFLVDGVSVSRASTTQTATLSHVPMRLMCGLAKFRLSDVRVLAL